MTDAINRKTVRNAVSALFARELVGSGKIAEALFGFKVGVIKVSPTIVVSSASSQREFTVLDGSVKWSSAFTFDVTDFIQDVKKDSQDSDYTEEDVEDLLDLVDAAISDVIAANRIFYIDGVGDVLLDLADEPSEINEDSQRGMVLESRAVVVYIKE